MPEVIVGRDEDDTKKYGTTGTLFMGKHLVGTGEDTHMTTPVLLDVLRPHIITISGKRGEGKCISSSTLIRLEDNSVVPIKELEKINKRVLALNKEGRIVPAKKSHFYKRNVNHMLKIKLSTGREIELTSEHPLLTQHGWKPAADLLIGSQIVVTDVNVSKSNNQALLISSIFLDTIVSVESLEGSFEVYDISVPEYHNFIANDIIVHNSFTMGVIMEEMLKLPPHIRKNLCGIVVDTQGIYWTMKSPSEKDATLLNAWEMKPSGFNVDVYVPEGQEKTFRSAGVDFDETFSFAPSDISAEDWLGVFDLNPNEPLGILMQRSITKLSGNYSIDDIIKSIKSSEGFENEKLALENRFEAAKSWGIFGSSRVPPLLEPGKMTILDISLTPQNVRTLLVGLVSKKIFLERVEARRKEELAEIEIATIKRTPMPWIFIDEAHNFLPSDGITSATEPLNRIVKEGRQPGITLVLATQRPEKLHPDALAQTDMIISHRLTAKNDVDALKAIMQTYLLYDIGKYINELPKLKGVAIILDDNSERLYKVRIRPRQSWHAGSSPVAIN
ncbi:MAG: DUF87 domain-containing protein [Candidatus Aenigmatarchaeota archaeon]